MALTLFRRRRVTALPTTEPVAVAVAPIRTAATPAGPQGYTAGYAGINVLAAHEQIGRPNGTPLTQVAGYVSELQRWQGVEGTTSDWLVDGKLSAGTGWQRTMHTGNAVEAQRMLDGNNGGLGPITARTMRANVTAQQIRQSGLAAVQWAQSLSPNA